jgi:transposase
MESESQKALSLQHQVAELERKVGQKQLQIDYLEKLIELASTNLGYDLKKTQI